MTNSETTFCVNGCTEPHDPGQVFPRCATVLPEPRGLSPKRCQSFCISIEKAQQQANPGLRLDLRDSAAMTCINCGHPVCLSCQTAPAGTGGELCGPCHEKAGAAYADTAPTP
ncbi:hypothetical protein ABT282_37945 [Streptomyces sp. NPDC000927]|uniref:hypothetical protein n=1 Tax=Streptomyces sp. NPDC000927 TaxID=3154371 RepID=UPI00332519C5